METRRENVVLKQVNAESIMKELRNNSGTRISSASGNAAILSQTRRLSKRISNVPPAFTVLPTLLDDAEAEKEALSTDETVQKQRCESVQKHSDSCTKYPVNEKKAAPKNAEGVAKITVVSPTDQSPRSVSPLGGVVSPSAGVGSHFSFNGITVLSPNGGSTQIMSVGTGAFFRDPGTAKTEHETISEKRAKSENLLTVTETTQATITCGQINVLSPHGTKTGLFGGNTPLDCSSRSALPLNGEKSTEVSPNGSTEKASGENGRRSRKSEKKIPSVIVTNFSPEEKKSPEFDRRTVPAVIVTTFSPEENRVPESEISTGNKNVTSTGEKSEDTRTVTDGDKDPPVLREDATVFKKERTAPLLQDVLKLVSPEESKIRRMSIGGAFGTSQIEGNVTQFETIGDYGKSDNVSIGTHRPSFNLGVGGRESINGNRSPVVPLGNRRSMRRSTVIDGTMAQMIRSSQVNIQLNPSLQPQNPSLALPNSFLRSSHRRRSSVATAQVAAGMYNEAVAEYNKEQVMEHFRRCSVAASGILSENKKTRTSQVALEQNQGSENEIPHSFSRANVTSSFVKKGGLSFIRAEEKSAQIRGGLRSSSNALEVALPRNSNVERKSTFSHSRSHTAESNRGSSKNDSSSKHNSSDRAIGAGMVCTKSSRSDDRNPRSGSGFDPTGISLDSDHDHVGFLPLASNRPLSPLREVDSAQNSPTSKGVHQNSSKNEGSPHALTGEAFSVSKLQKKKDHLEDLCVDEENSLDISEQRPIMKQMSAPPVTNPGAKSEKASRRFTQQNMGAFLRRQSNAFSATAIRDAAKKMMGPLMTKMGHSSRGKDEEPTGDMVLSGLQTSERLKGLTGGNSGEEVPGLVPDAKDGTGESLFEDANCVVSTEFLTRSAGLNAPFQGDLSLEEFNELGSRRRGSNAPKIRGSLRGSTRRDSNFRGSTRRDRASRVRKSSVMSHIALEGQPLDGGGSTLDLSSANPSANPESNYLLSHLGGEGKLLQPGGKKSLVSSRDFLALPPSASRIGSRRNSRVDAQIAGEDPEMQKAELAAQLFVQNSTCDLQAKHPSFPSASRRASMAMVNGVLNQHLGLSGSGDVMTQNATLSALAYDASRDIADRDMSGSQMSGAGAPFVGGRTFPPGHADLLDLGEPEAEDTHGDWSTILLTQGTLGNVHRESRYPNTPLSLLWLQDATSNQHYLLVGLLSNPTLLKILPPKISVLEEDLRSRNKGKGLSLDSSVSSVSRVVHYRGRFNVLPLDASRFLVCDEDSHCVLLVYVDVEKKTRAPLCPSTRVSDTCFRGVCRAPGQGQHRVSIDGRETPFNEGPETPFDEGRETQGLEVETHAPVPGHSPVDFKGDPNLDSAVFPGFSLLRGDDVSHGTSRGFNSIESQERASTPQETSEVPGTSVTGMRTVLAGCGKRGHLDGPLQSCRLDSPSCVVLDPNTFSFYIADTGNHVIRKMDLAKNLMTTVCGNGMQGSRDSCYQPLQSLDTPFFLSFSEPHYLLISCADNSLRKFDIRGGGLETVLIGS